MSEEYRDAPFRHSSTTHTARSVTETAPASYDQLEFLGDAYLELFATKIIFHEYRYLPAGRMSQLREALVKNETLAQYSLAYGFDQRVHIADIERQRMKEGAKDRGNKGFNKVMGDVFEAYLAAVVLDDSEHGEQKASEWMRKLWQPKIDAVVEVSHRPVQADRADSSASSNPLRTTYDDTAKAQLQKRLAGKDTKLEYEPYQAPIELKGVQLGQNQHFIALYYTGFGYNRELLGKGEGKNKVEAGNWAALEAMHGDKSSIVLECQKRIEAMREAKRLRQEQEARDG